LATFSKHLFNDVLKNVTARSTLGHCKWHSRMPRHLGWEPLSYRVSKQRNRKILMNGTAYWWQSNTLLTHCPNFILQINRVW